MTDQPLPNIDTDREQQMQRTADHDREIVAFQGKLRELCNAYWFLGKVEIIGALETAKFRALSCWEKDDAPDDDDEGEEWKKAGTPS